MVSLEDPDIRQGEQHHVPDLKGCQFNMFSSISHLYLLWRRPKSIAKLDGSHGRIAPGFAPGSTTVLFDFELVSA